MGKRGHKGAYVCKVGGGGDFDTADHNSFFFKYSYSLMLESAPSPLSRNMWHPGIVQCTQLNVYDLSIF